VAVTLSVRGTSVTAWDGGVMVTTLLAPLRVGCEPKGKAQDHGRRVLPCTRAPWLHRAPLCVVLRPGLLATGVDRFAVANFDDSRASARGGYERPNPVAMQRDTVMFCDPSGGRDSVLREPCSDIPGVTRQL